MLLPHKLSFFKADVPIKSPFTSKNLKKEIKKDHDIDNDNTNYLINVVICRHAFPKKSDSKD